MKIPVLREFKFNGVSLPRRDGTIIISNDREDVIITRRPAGLDGLGNTRINRIKKVPVP